MLTGFFPLDCATDTDWRFERLRLALQARASLTHTVYAFYERECFLSQGSCDLIDGMLALFPTCRLSASGVLRSDWVTQAGTANGASALGSYLSRTGDLSEASVAPAYRNARLPTMDAHKLQAVLDEFSMAAEHSVRPFYRSGSATASFGRAPPELERQTPFLGAMDVEPGAMRLLRELTRKASEAAGVLQVQVTAAGAQETCAIQ
jgi:serine/threonine protein kinase